MSEFRFVRLFCRLRRCRRLRLILSCSVCLLLNPGFSSLSVASDVVQACVNCHGQEGRARMPGWPKLRQFDAQTLRAKLEAYRDGRVPDSSMHQVAHQLSDQDIARVVTFYARDDNDDEQGAMRPATEQPQFSPSLD